MLGKKHMEQLAGYTVSLLAYGAACFVGMVYVTDWRCIVTNIPFYNLEFKNEKRADDD